MVRNINNKLETDSHDYLLYSSAHPQRCIDSIPYSEFLRIRRLCSRVVDFEKHVFALSLYFQRREYPEDLILDAAILTIDWTAATCYKAVIRYLTPTKKESFLSLHFTQTITH